MTDTNDFKRGIIDAHLNQIDILITYLRDSQDTKANNETFHYLLRKNMHGIDTYAKQ